jgi:hypothetical protein
MRATTKLEEGLGPDERDAAAGGRSNDLTKTTIELEEGLTT